MNIFYLFVFEHVIIAKTAEEIIANQSSLLDELSAMYTKKKPVVRTGQQSDFVFLSGHGKSDK